MLPVLPGRWWLRGIVLSLAPSAFQLLYLFPRKSGHGLFGLGLGTLTPIFVLAANPLWGLAAAWLLHMTGRAWRLNQVSHFVIESKHWLEFPGGHVSGITEVLRRMATKPKREARTGVWNSVEFVVVIPVARSNDAALPYPH